MKSHIRDRIPDHLYQALVNRTRTVRSIAAELGLSENYLSHAISERAPKRHNKRLLKTTRKLYHDQIVREVLDGRHTVREAADLANMSERTMYRRLARARAVPVQELVMPSSEAAETENTGTPPCESSSSAPT